MQHPELAVVVNEPARMIHLGKGVHLVGHPIAISINAAHHAAATLLLAKRALFINAHKHLARRGCAQANGIIHQWRLGKERELEALRRLYALKRRLDAATVAHPGIGVLRGLHHLARQLGHRAGVRLKLPQAAPHTRAGSQEGDLEKPRGLRVHLVWRNLQDRLVLGFINQLLPVLAIGRTLDGVLVGAIGFLPNDADVLDVLRLSQVHLQPFAFFTACSAPARGGIAIHRKLGKVSLARLL